MEVFFEIHSDNPREGPGDNESTRKAYSFLKDLPVEPRILDIGCGPGMQTVELAKISRGHIVALDNHKPFLVQLKHLSQAEGVANQIEALNRSMFEMDFDEKSFDVIWSEGAIYFYGFEQGLIDWRPLLKKEDSLSFRNIL